MSDTSHDVQSVIEALQIIRDNILTDENLNTAKGVIDKMSELLLGVYDWFINSSVEEEELLEAATEAGVEEETRSLVTPLFQNEPNAVWSDIEQAFEGTSRGITMSGVLEAIQFIRDHLSKSDDILSDIMKIVDALKQIKLYSEEEGDSRSLDIDREGLRTLYDDLTKS